MTNETPEIIDATPEIIDAEANSNRQADPEIDDLVEDMVDVGRMWAQHGITIGKMALKSSARTLEVTSNVLETLARRVAPKNQDAKAKA